MKKTILFVAALVCAAVTLNAEKTVLVDTVFTDDFSTLKDCYTITSPGDKVMVDNNALKMGCPKNGTSAQNIAVADYGKEAVKLNEMDVDSIVWTFNMRNGYGKTTDNLSGFDSSKRGFATMLLSDADNLTTANGYAVVMGGNSKIQYRLVKVEGGLLGNSHLTDIIGGQVDASTEGHAKYYYTFRITYVPSTKTWTMQETSAATAFVAPADVTEWIMDGSAADDAFGATPVKYFGFYHNYTGSTDFNVLFDNFTMVTYKTTGSDTPTAIDDIKADKKSKKVMENGQFVIMKNGVFYSILGIER